MVRNRTNKKILELKRAIKVDYRRTRRVIYYGVQHKLRKMTGVAIKRQKWQDVNEEIQTEVIGDQIWRNLPLCGREANWLWNFRYQCATGWVQSRTSQRSYGKATKPESARPDERPIYTIFSAEDMPQVAPQHVAARSFNSTAVVSLNPIEAQKRRMKIKGGRQYITFL